MLYYVQLQVTWRHVVVTVGAHVRRGDALQISPADNLSQVVGLIYQ